MLIAFVLLCYSFLLTFTIGKQSWKFLMHTFQITEQKFIHFSLYPVIGLAILSPVIGLYHFFFPIDIYLQLFFVAYLLISFTGIKSEWVAVWKEIRNNPWLYLLLVFGALLSIIARPGTGDIADYHLQAIKWAENYPNIPGLGNFNRPLANNNWWFNLQAFFGFSGLGVHSVYVGNALFFICLFSWFYFSEPISKAHQWLRFFYAAFIIFSLKTAFVGAVTPDFVVTLMIYLCLDLFLIGSNRIELKNACYLLLIVFISWILTVKATAIVFFMLPLLWFLEFIQKKQSGIIWKTLLLSLIFLIPWLIGNVIICGYLLYPFEGIDLFSVDWKVPAQYFEFDKMVIRNWGKVPGQDIVITQKMALQEWFPLWLSKLDLLNTLLIIGFAFSLPVVWIGMWKKRETFWPLLFIQVSFLIIFLNGPHPRFLFGYMVSNLAFAFYLFGSKIPFNIPRYVLPIIGILLSSLLFIKQFDNGSLEQGCLIPKPYPDMNLEDRSLGDFHFYYSKEASQCWDKFPSTYYFIDSVQLRGTDIRKGFQVKAGHSF